MYWNENEKGELEISVKLYTKKESHVVSTPWNKIFLNRKVILVQFHSVDPLNMSHLCLCLRAFLSYLFYAVFIFMLVHLVNI